MVISGSDLENHVQRSLIHLGMCIQYWHLKRILNEEVVLYKVLNTCASQVAVQHQEKLSFPD